jgi:hypothetical protein
VPLQHIRQWHASVDGRALILSNSAIRTGWSIASWEVWPGPGHAAAAELHGTHNSHIGTQYEVIISPQSLQFTAHIEILGETGRKETDYAEGWGETAGTTDPRMVKFTDRVATRGGKHEWHSRKHTGTTKHWERFRNFYNRGTSYTSAIDR